MRDGRGGPFAAARFVERLASAGSSLGRQLTAAMHLPLREYLRSLIPPPPTEPPGRALRLLLRSLEGYLAARDEPDPAGVCEALSRTRVIQQADHASLLLDPETFLNNFLFHAAAREAGLGVAITSQCTTVACLSRRFPVRGPVFLWTRGGCYQVFDFSKRQLKDATFCALPMPARLTFRALAGPVPRPQDDAVLAPLEGRPADDPADAFREANAGIWERLQVDRRVRRVAVDERVAAEATALHVEEGDGAVFRLLFDPAVRDRFLAAKRRLVASPRNLVVNRAAPDFLWYRKGTRLRAVVLEGSGPGARWVMESDGSPLSLAFEPGRVVSALRAGELVPDRVLAYLVRCILPGVVAVGGTVQQDYVELYQQMLLEAHAGEPFLDDREVCHAADPGLTRLGGAPLLEPDAAGDALLQALGPTTPLGEWEAAFLDLPLSRTLGRMKCAAFFDGLLARRREQFAGTPTLA